MGVNKTISDDYLSASSFRKVQRAETTARGNAARPCALLLDRFLQPYTDSALMALAAINVMPAAASWEPDFCARLENHTCLNICDGSGSPKNNSTFRLLLLCGIEKDEIDVICLSKPLHRYLCEQVHLILFRVPEPPAPFQSPALPCCGGLASSIIEAALTMTICQEAGFQIGGEALSCPPCVGHPTRSETK